MQVREKILNKAEEEFFRIGVKSVTMDDIARAMGISKKTLYHSFESKRDLVNQVIQRHIEDDKSRICEISKAAGNAIDELLEVGSYIGHEMVKINPTVIFDLRKNYPKSWELFKDMSDQFVYNQIGANIERGIEEGMYRKNLKPEIIARFFTTWMSRVDEEMNFFGSKYHFAQIYLEFVSYHIHGIASEKGINYLKSLKFD